ncbi:MAG: response regulator [Ferruginibacter sp.]|nr:response regulator [Cytophagales bacterium]
MDSLKVLIVEDETVLAFGLKVQFDRWGFGRVEIADSGATALEVLRDWVPALLIVNLDLKDGLETARLIHDQHPVPMLLLSEWLEEAENRVRRLQSMNNYACLRKPCTVEELKLTVEHLLSLRLSEPA